MFLSNEIESAAFGKLTKESKKAKGQFYTPFFLAQFMAELVWEKKTDDDSKNLDFLDPASGTGVFSRALEDKLSKTENLIKHDLYEIDNIILDELKTNTIPKLKGKPTVFSECFLNSSWDKSYDIILANPPYYKHHYFKDKDKIKQIFNQRLSGNFSVQTSIYCWFLIKAVAQLKVGGRLAFIIPSEFLNSNYGKAIKEFLKSNDLVVNLISFDYKDSMFKDAITTSLVVYIKKTNGLKTHPIRFYHISKALLENAIGKTLLTIAPFVEYGPEELLTNTKWKNFFPGREKTIHPRPKNTVHLSHYGVFKKRNRHWRK